MNAPQLKVGDAVIHVERFHHSSKNQREIYRTTIVRETPTQWVDAKGDHWRKGDGAMVPQRYTCPRFIVPVAPEASS